MTRLQPVLLAAALCASLASVAQGQARYPAAQRVVPPSSQADAESNVVGVEGAGIGGTYLRIAGDLANALNKPGLRVVPIVGQGSVQNVDDLLHLRGVDVAIVQADVLAYVRREHMLPPGGERTIQYIAKLYDEEVHIVAGPQVHTLDDLKGKAVNADLPRSGSTLTARVLFAALGIPVTLTEEPQDVAIERLKRGEIAAVVRVAGKPVDIFKALPDNLGLHILGLPQDKEQLLQTYAPGSFTSADYPNLVANGETVDTLAVGAVMAVYAWPAGSVRYRQITRLVTELFAQFDHLQAAPAHPKWKEVNLSAEVPGWTRFAAAAEQVSALRNKGLEQDFESFLSAGSATAGLTSQQKAALFDQFVRWRRGGSGQ
ncbi:MAG: TAXI family TRAP transporter solute-binding subunit [Janthinobacterium lividum]